MSRCTRTYGNPNLDLLTTCHLVDFDRLLLTSPCARTVFSGYVLLSYLWDCSDNRKKHVYYLFCFFETFIPTPIQCLHDYLIRFRPHISALPMRIVYSLDFLIAAIATKYLYLESQRLINCNADNTQWCQTCI